MKLAHQTLKSKKKICQESSNQNFLSTNFSQSREWVGPDLHKMQNVILSQEGLAHNLLQTNSWTREEKRNTHTHKTKQNKTKQSCRDPSQKKSPNPNTKTQNKLKSNYLSFFGAPKQTFTKRSSQNQSSATYLPFVDWCKQFAAIPRACWGNQRAGGVVFEYE